MRGAIIAAAAVVAATGAQAQTNTTCTTMGGTTNCTSTQMPRMDFSPLTAQPAPNPFNALAAGMAARQSSPVQASSNGVIDSCADAGMITDCSGKQIKRAKAARALREEVGADAAEGRCEDGVKKALRAGDFDLAERIKRLCAPTSQ